MAVRVYTLVSRNNSTLTPSGQVTFQLGSNGISVPAVNLISPSTATSGFTGTHILGVSSDGKHVVDVDPSTLVAVGSVTSVNGETGDVVLTAADVEADPAGTAATSMAAHIANLDPHPQYALDADLAGYSVVGHTHAASAIVSGTLSDARLSANIPLINAATNTFTGTLSTPRVSVPALVTGLANPFVIRSNTGGTFTEPSHYLGIQGSETSGLAFRSNGQVQFMSQVSIGQFNDIQMGGTTAPYGFTRGSAQNFQLGGVADITADAGTGTSVSIGASATTSTTAKQGIWKQLCSWLVNTQATRLGQIEEFVASYTGWQRSRRVYSDGSRAYTALTVHTTAPADADLQASETALYTDGSALFAKLKNASSAVYTIPLAGSGGSGGATFSGPINYPASAPGGWWVNPRDFGGDPSLTDNYPALLAAVNAAQGGVVAIPPGDYKFATTTTLTLPPGVSVRGSYGGPSSSPGYRDGGTQPTTGGTRFLIKQSSVTPFQAWHNGGFDGVIFYHPDQAQVASTPTVYPATVKMRGSNPFVRNCQFLNSYIAININNIDSTNNGITQRPTVENVTGQPLSRGITMGMANDDGSTTGYRGILDCARFINVHFNPWWSYPQGGSPMEFLANLYAWQLANGYAFEIGDCDEFFASGCFAYGYNRGISLSSIHRGAYGSFTGGGFDLCVSGVYCTGSQQQGVRFQGLGIALGDGGGAAINVSGGSVSIHNSNFWHANPAIACSGGRVSATGCDFQVAGTQVTQSSTGKVNVVGGFANGGLVTSGTVSSTGVGTY